MRTGPGWLRRIRVWRSPEPLTWHLVALVVGAVLPILLLSTIVVWQLADRERLAVEERLRGTVRAAAISVDRELKESISALEILASSTALDMEDFPSFYDEARQAQRIRGWLSVLLLREDGRQILNVTRPLGTALANLGDRAYFKAVLETRRPAVSGRIVGRTIGVPTVAVAVPATRRDRIPFVVVAALDAAVLARRLADDFRAGEWTSKVVDAAGVIARSARSSAWAGPCNGRRPCWPSAHTSGRSRSRASAKRARRPRRRPAR
jgi:hypothetical protein